jgi:molecular chaperone GrpE (heat shock protein)
MAQNKEKDEARADPSPEDGAEALSVIVDNDGTPAEIERARVAELERALADANTKIAELKDQNLRALAETENVRRRVQRDRDEALKFATTGLAKDLLPWPIICAVPSRPSPRMRSRRTRRSAASPPAWK